MSAILSSTFWLLLNTPMVPPERTAKNHVVPMVDLNPAASSHKRRRSLCEQQTQLFRKRRRPGAWRCLTSHICLSLILGVHIAGPTLSFVSLIEESNTPDRIVLGKYCTIWFIALDRLGV
ncbi:hypothetical protein ACG7TL_006158 [Trametes sanguinea]